MPPTKPTKAQVRTALALETAKKAGIPLEALPSLLAELPSGESWFSVLKAAGFNVQSRGPSIAHMKAGGEPITRRGAAARLRASGAFRESEVGDIGPYIDAATNNTFLYRLEGLCGAGYYRVDLPKKALPARTTGDASAAGPSSTVPPPASPAVAAAAAAPLQPQPAAAAAPTTAAAAAAPTASAAAAAKAPPAAAKRKEAADALCRASDAPSSSVVSSADAPSSSVVSSAKRVRVASAGPGKASDPAAPPPAAPPPARPATCSGKAARALEGSAPLAGNSSEEDEIPLISPRRHANQSAKQSAKQSADQTDQSANQSADHRCDDVLFSPTAATNSAPALAVAAPLPLPLALAQPLTQLLHLYPFGAAGVGSSLGGRTEITIPEGAVPGMPLDLIVPDGPGTCSRVRIIVPVGMRPGMKLAVAMPPYAPPVAVQPLVPEMATSEMATSEMARDQPRQRPRQPGAVSGQAPLARRTSLASWRTKAAPQSGFALAPALAPAPAPAPARAPVVELDDEEGQEDEEVAEEVEEEMEGFESSRAAAALEHASSAFAAKHSPRDPLKAALAPLDTALATDPPPSALSSCECEWEPSALSSSSAVPSSKVHAPPHATRAMPGPPLRQAQLPQLPQVQLPQLPQAQLPQLPAARGSRLAVLSGQPPAVTLGAALSGQPPAVALGAAPEPFSEAAALAFGVSARVGVEAVAVAEALSSCFKGSSTAPAPAAPAPSAPAAASFTAAAAVASAAAPSAAAASTAYNDVDDDDVDDFVVSASATPTAPPAPASAAGGSALSALARAEAQSLRNAASGQMAPAEPKKARVRRPWTVAEVEALRVGVLRYGEGRWEAIRLDTRLGSDLTYRLGVDLKDKWRNLKDKGQRLAPHASSAAGSAPSLE